jgi:hypothetical protein
MIPTAVSVLPMQKQQVLLECDVLGAIYPYLWGLYIVFLEMTCEFLLPVEFVRFYFSFSHND